MRIASAYTRNAKQDEEYGKNKIYSSSFSVPANTTRQQENQSIVVCGRFSEVDDLCICDHLWGSL